MTDVRLPVLDGTDKVPIGHLPTGTTSSTVTIGNDSRVTGAAQKASNLSDLANAATARTNLGLGTAVTVAATVSTLAELVAAVAAVTSGAIFAKAGTYLLTAALHPKSGVTIQGEGDSTILKVANGANVNAIMVDVGTIGVQIRDLQIDGNSANNDYGINGIAVFGDRCTVSNVHVKAVNGYNIVGFPGASNMTVTRCLSETAVSECIEFQGVLGGVIANNTVLNAGKNGITVYAQTGQGGSCHDVAVIGNLISGSSALGSGFAGILVDDGAENVTIAGNTVTGGGTNANGIRIGSTTATGLKGITVSGNTVRGVPAAGILVRDKCSHVSVAGNTITGSGTYGIYLTGANANPVTFSGNSVTGSTQGGVLVSSSAVNFAFTGNQISGNTQRGVEISGAKGFSLTGNIVSSNGASYDGVTVYSASSGGAISGNEFTGNGRCGLRIDDSSDIAVSGNSCRNNGQGGTAAYAVGIYVSVASGVCSDITLTGNRCNDGQASKTQYYGIKTIGAVSNIALSGNMLEGNNNPGGGTGLSTDGNAVNLNSVPYRKIAATVGATQTTIAHGLPYTPLAIAVTMTSAGTAWVSAAADATNIYLTADSGGRTVIAMVG